MISLTWVALLSPFQMVELQNLFVSTFLVEGRSSEVHLNDYFENKIEPRIEKGNALLLGYDKERIVAFALFEHWEEHTYYLAEMVVATSYQRQGIGKKLILALFEKDPAAQKIVLVTEVANNSAQAFYKAIGFKPSAFRHPDYSTDFTGYEYTYLGL